MPCSSVFDSVEVSHLWLLALEVLSPGICLIVGTRSPWKLVPRPE